LRVKIVRTSDDVTKKIFLNTAYAHLCLHLHLCIHIYLSFSLKFAILEKKFRSEHAKPFRKNYESPLQIFQRDLEPL